MNSFTRTFARRSSSRTKRQVLFVHGVLLLLAFWASVDVRAAASNSIARVWDERALAAIRVDTPHPPAQARNLFTFSLCMYDAWAAYDTNGAVGYIYRGKHTAVDIAAARREAISYAVWRMQKERHVYSRTAASTLGADDAQMVALGYSTSNTSRDTSTPAGVGNTIFDAVSLWFSNDGSRQTNGTPYNPALPGAVPIAYPDYPVGDSRRYVFTNPALATDRAGIDDGFGNTVVDINRWQRLNVVNAVDQNGFPTSPSQPYLGAQWLGVRPFAVTRTDSTKPWVDPGPPPFFGGPTHAAFRSNVVEVIRRSSELTPDDGVVTDISPGAFGNNTLGTSDGNGYTNNPVTGLPYAPNLVKRGDFARVLAEFWADGPNSETPPGHWNTIANDVSDNTNFIKRIGGSGPVVDDLEWDVKLYFALSAAVQEGGCAAWALKRYYDAWRPISAVRYLGGIGQSSDPSAPSYHTNGLPLITNLIEVVTSSSVASGRHAGLTPGKIALLAWPGQPANPVTTYRGVKWLHADTWVPYQRTNFVTPAFPGYVSGHSTFSRSAAEVLTAITGSRFFPDGMGTYTAAANTALGFERGPSEAVTLQWATYYDAADQAGLSRIWGGIHPPADDFAGRRVGAACGKEVWDLAQRYWDGSVTNTPVTLALRKVNAGTIQITFNTLRGFYYKLNSTTNCSLVLTEEPGGATLALDGSITRTNTISGPEKYYRVTASSFP